MICGCHWDDQALEACRQGDCRDQRERQRRVDDDEARADGLRDQQRDDASEATR